MRKIVGIFILITFVFATQYIPIPRTQYGLSIGDPSGALHIQAFYDLLCSDSKDSDAILREVFKTISLTRSSIRFTYNFNPLPYHFYAFKTHQAYQYILSKLGANAAELYVRFIFDSQDDYAQQVWQSRSINQFLDSFSQTIAQRFSINQSELRQALSPGTSHDFAARYQWKYSSGSNSISGTPIFYANGIRIDGAEDWRYQDWIDFLTNSTTK